MSKTKKEDVAKHNATERNEYYGMSVFDGWFYTGSIPELERIGCVKIRHWSADDEEKKQP